MILNSTTRKNRTHKGGGYCKNKDLKRGSKKIQEMFKSKRKTEQKNIVVRT